jgi:hypothetical protein
MTKVGTINTQPVQMLRERLRSVGLSLLSGNSGVEGLYELGIDDSPSQQWQPNKARHFNPALKELIGTLFFQKFRFTTWLQCLNSMDRLCPVSRLTS